MIDSSDESGNEIKVLPRRTETKKQSKNGALWKEMLEEESLMEDMKTCEVAINLRKRKVDRGTESYDYSELDNRPKHDENPPAQTSERKKFKLKHNNHKDKEPKRLLDITVFDEGNDDEIAADIALKLGEDNLELIKKVVSAIGMDKCVKFYQKTQKIEQNGGLLTVNKERRRTSGGIFLFLIKTSNEITDEEKKKIFEKDTAR